MKSVVLAALVVAGGCGVHASDGARSAGGGDGGGSSEPRDAPPSTTSSDAPDEPPAATCASRVVYLAFDGVDLKSTNVRSDATINAAFWAGHNLTVPAYHANDANRASDIAVITQLIRDGLAQFPITVVTDRPATGPYAMIAFGGRSTTNFGYSTEYYAIDTLDCGDTWPSDVGWVSDIVASNQLVADNALGALGFGLGLSGTTDPTTCMCGWSSDCDSADVPCTFGAHAVADQCNHGTPTTQDETAVFHKAFCE